MRYRLYFFYSILLILCISVISFSQKANTSIVTSVNYISAENVYLSTGSVSGVQIGDKFTVFRNEKVIGHIEVVYVAQNSASCKIINKSQSFAKNDKAVRTFTIPKKEVVADTTKEERQRTIPKYKRTKLISKSFARLSGSVSLQWYEFMNSRESDLSYLQPSLRLNFKARQLWGKDFNFYIKLRSRYNDRASRFSNSSLNDKLSNRIYILGFEYTNDHAPVNFKIGRIISNQISGIGYFDGVLLQYNTSDKFKMGIFAGAQPQWQYSDFQTSSQKYGIYLNYRQGNYRTLRFESTLAAAGEYHEGTISREFVYIQNRLNIGSKWHVYQSMSLDINRDWRKEVANETISISNLYVSGRYKFTKMLTAGLSYDNRKRYLTYEIKSAAEELFDNAQRQGLKTNLIFTFPYKIRLSANLGLRKKQGESETTYSYNSSLSKNNLIIKNLRCSISFSGFSNLYTKGYNPAFRLTQYFNAGHSFGISGGSYLYSLNDGNADRSNNWAGLDTYIYLLKSVFLTTNYEYNWGNDSEGHRIVAELGYRF